MELISVKSAQTAPWVIFESEENSSIFVDIPRIWGGEGDSEGLKKGIRD